MSVSNTSQRPNIVYILADDMGYGDVSCLNPDSQIRTANLDTLAAEGMTCTDVHACSSVCTPSRYGLLTGRYAWRTPMKQGVLWGYSTPLIAHERLTAASLVKRHGYRTACYGKWHLGMDFPTTDGQPAKGDETRSNVDWNGRIADSPLDHGFDHYYGISASLDMPPYVYIEDDRFVGTPTETKAFLEPNRPGLGHKDFEAVDVLPTITRKAVEFIEDCGDQPFFLYLPLNAPHTPLVPSPSFQGKSMLNPYADFCLEVDWTVGQVMRALEQTGVAERTLFIFTSDNGCSPMADFDVLQTRGHYPSYHFRGHKADIYEGGHRIPFVVRWPEVIAPGATSCATVCLTDLIATIADMLGDALPDHAGEDSVSMLPVLKGTTGAPLLHEAVVHHSIQGMFSIRRDHWKLEMCPGSGGWSSPKDDEAVKAGLPPIQLYDLGEDIGERHNVYADHPEVVDRLLTLLSNYVREGRSTPGKRQANDGPAHWTQLCWVDTC
ncbi:MAG: arylsulfatase [Candidatus Latescibacteria bacterium]|jgi:arylsulfatase A-like enzyme|nr:arylsulfatase [Candidatus Latescibacterota bacterium]MDP7235327.1 arylsulfatase [Candidatus Latescibacterota bacterium]